MTARARPRARRRVGARPPSPAARSAGGSDARLPAPGRIAAGLLTAVLVGGLLALINGPWLRGRPRGAGRGSAYTPASRSCSGLLALARRRRRCSTVDAHAPWTPSCSGLPAVSGVTPRWRRSCRTRSAGAHRREGGAPSCGRPSAVRLVGATDGTLIGQLALDADLPADLADAAAHRRPRASRPGPHRRRPDRRQRRSRAALRLSEVEPAALGSTAAVLRSPPRPTTDGFLLVSPQAGWQADFGFYPDADPADTPDTLERRRSSAGQRRSGPSSRSSRRASVAWVDARDPRRVYWRAR